MGSGKSPCFLVSVFVHVGSLGSVLRALCDPILQCNYAYQQLCLCMLGMVKHRKVICLSLRLIYFSILHPDFYYLHDPLISVYNHTNIATDNHYNVIFSSLLLLILF